MSNVKGIELVLPVVDIDAGFLNNLAQRLFLSRSTLYGTDMQDSCTLPSNSIDGSVVADMNYVLRQYFPVTPYRNIRMHMARRMPMHRTRCDGDCLLLTVVINTSILGHSLYVLTADDVNDKSITEANSVVVSAGDGFIYDNALWLSFLPESLDNDYAMVIQAEIAYHSEEEKQKILTEAREARSRVFKQ